MSTLALVSLVVVVYTYAGYPLLVMGLAALWRLRPSRRAPALSGPRFEPTVSICIAVHNGAAHLPRKLASLAAQDYPPEKTEIIVYSDGSTDETEALVRAFAARDPRVKLLNEPRRLGKPTALNGLREAARGEVLILNDVRQALAPNAVSELVRSLADPRIGCVSGNLVLAGSAGSAAYWRYEKLIRGCEAELGTMAGVTGSIYAIRREDFPKLPSDLILDDMWVPLWVALRKKRIVLAETACAFDDAFDDDREFARKVRTLAGNYQLVRSMPEILLPFVNPSWFPLVSHKLMRLFCPWALVVLFASSLGVAFGIEATEDAGAVVPRMEIWLWRSLVGAQIVFYGFALLGQRVGKLGQLARTFAVLNVAAVVGLWRWMRGTQAVTW